MFVHNSNSFKLQLKTNKILKLPCFSFERVGMCMCVFLFNFVCVCMFRMEPIQLFFSFKILKNKCQLSINEIKCRILSNGFLICAVRIVWIFVVFFMIFLILLLLLPLVWGKEFWLLLINLVNVYVNKNINATH